MGPCNRLAGSLTGVRLSFLVVQVVDWDLASCLCFDHELMKRIDTEVNRLIGGYKHFHS